MKLLVLFVTVCAVAVWSERCHDTTECMTVQCDEVNNTLACTGGSCTCEAKPKSCMEKDECAMVRCHNHEESGHCIDRGCACMKDHDIHAPGGHDGPGHHGPVY